MSCNRTCLAAQGIFNPCHTYYFYLITYSFMKQLLKSKLTLGMFLLLTILFFHCSKTSQTTTPPPPTPPVLTAVSPVNGISGDAVTLTGKNLDNADKISFSGITSTIVQNTGTSITSVVPSGATVGTNKITIHNSGGTSNELSFEVLKKPVIFDSFPPSLTKTIPSSAYAESPVLIYGDNLSGVIEISFNDKPAVVFTNNKTVITANVPKDIPAGNATIKARTVKGTATLSFQVLGPLPGGAAVVNFSIVTIPPPGYVATISNDWSLGLLSRVDYDSNTHTGTFIDPNSDTSGNNNEFAITGRYEYYFDTTLNYNTKNYIEIIDHHTGDTLAGQFSSKFVKPCVLKMVLVSSKTGKVVLNTFDLKNAGFPDGCEE